MPYFFGSVTGKDERNRPGRLSSFLEAASDAVAIQEMQDIATWLDGVSGVVIKSISLVELFKVSAPSGLKATPNSLCEIEKGSTLNFGVDNPNPFKTCNIKIRTHVKSDFEARTNALTQAATTAWEGAMVSASGATEYFADSNYDRLERLIYGKERRDRVSSS